MRSPKQSLGRHNASILNGPLDESFPLGLSGKRARYKVDARLLGGGV